MIINTPFSGKLNLDDAEYRVSNNDYIDALNITKDAQGAGQDKVVSNILGNTLIPYTAPTGTNKVIGFYADSSTSWSFANSIFYSKRYFKN